MLKHYYTENVTKKIFGKVKGHWLKKFKKLKIKKNKKIEALQKCFPMALRTGL